jgi:hypothetical protein
LTVKLLKEKSEHQEARLRMLAPTRFISFILILIDIASSLDEQYGEQSSYKLKLKSARMRSNKLTRKATRASSVAEKRSLLRRADEELNDYNWADRAWPEGMRSVQFAVRKHPEELSSTPRGGTSETRKKRVFIVHLSDFFETLTGEQLCEELAAFTELALEITIDKHEVRSILQRPTDRAGRQARSCGKDKKPRSRSKKRVIRHTILKSKRVS